MEGFCVATVRWQDMQIEVAGKVIKFPGSGFLWHVLQSRPRARCVLWLYETGCTGAACSLGLSGTSFALPAVCCAFSGRAAKSNEADNTAGAHGAIHTVHLLRTVIPPARFEQQVSANFCWMASPRLPRCSFQNPSGSPPQHCGPASR